MLLGEIHRHGLTELLKDRVRAHVEALKPKRRYRKKGLASTESDILWDLARKIILIRDDFKCRKCGVTQLTRKPGDYEHGYSLHVHHIRSQGAHPELKYELSNLLTLCQNCHMPWRKDSAHSSDPQPFQDWLREHLGQPYLDTLDTLTKIRKGSRTDKKLMRVFLEQELKRLTG